MVMLKTARVDFSKMLTSPKNFVSQVDRSLSPSRQDVSTDTGRRAHLRAYQSVLSGAKSFASKAQKGEFELSEDYKLFLFDFIEGLEDAVSELRTGRVLKGYLKFRGWWDEEVSKELSSGKSLSSYSTYRVASRELRHACKLLLSFAKLAVIIPMEDRYLVKTKDLALVLGAHDTKEEAERQLAAIETRKARRT